MKLKPEIIGRSDFDNLLKGTTAKEVLLEIINSDFYISRTVEIFRKEIQDQLKLADLERFIIK